MTRTLRILTRLNIGGPAINVTMADAGLRERGYDTLLVHGSLEPGEASAAPLAAARGVPLLSLPALVRPVSPLRDIVAWRAVVRLLRERQPAIVHTHTSKAGTVGRLAAIWHNLGRGERRCRLVHTFDGHVFDGYFGPVGSRLIIWTERALARWTDAIVAVAPRQRDDLVGRYGIGSSSRVVVVPHGLDLEPFLSVPGSDLEARRTLGLPAGAFVAVFAGRLVPIKDVPTLLDAFARMRAGWPGSRLVVAGDGELRSALEARANTLGLGDAVRWVGWRRDLTTLYGAADVVVLSSRSEGTPLTLIEALASGRPAVATAVGGVPDVVRDGQTGMLVPAGDPEAFADAMLRLARDPSSRQAMGAAARADMRTRYSAARLADDLDALYRALLEGRMAQ